MIVEAVGGLADLEDTEGTIRAGGRHLQIVGTADDRLAVVVRLFARLASGERLVARSDAMGIGLQRRGSAAIWKRYVGPPSLSSDPAERERFLEQYRVSRRDVEDAVAQMLGRDPEQHRPPRLSWQTLIDRLVEDGIQIDERQLIDLPFCCEFSARLQAELVA